MPITEMTYPCKFIHRVRENGTNNMTNSKVLKNRVCSIITSLYFPIYGLDQRGSFISVYKSERKSIFIIKPMEGRGTISPENCFSNVGAD